MSQRDQPKRIRDRTQQNDQYKYRRYIPDHDTEDLLAAERMSVHFHFLLDAGNPYAFGDEHTDRQIAKAAMGIITELVRKSKKSRKGIPMMVIKESGP